MNRKLIAGLLGAAMIVLLGVGVLRGQKEKSTVTRGAVASVWPAGEGGAEMGVRLSDVTAEKVRELKLPGEYGAVITDVRRDSPAAKAGLERDDCILAFAGERVWSVAELRRLVRETPPGRTVNLEISRAGKKQNLSVTLEEREEALFPPRVEVPHIEIPPVRVPKFDFNLYFPPGPRLGISADDLTSQLAEYFGVREGKGVLVREVMPDTPAQKAGLKAGDCIVKVGKSEIGSVSDLHRALVELSDDNSELTLTIVRDRQEQTLSVKIEKPRPWFRDPDAEAALLGFEVGEF